MPVRLTGFGSGQTFQTPRTALQIQQDSEFETGSGQSGQAAPASVSCDQIFSSLLLGIGAKKLSWNKRNFREEDASKFIIVIWILPHNGKKRHLANVSRPSSRTRALPELWPHDHHPRRVRLVPCWCLSRCHADNMYSFYRPHVSRRLVVFACRSSDQKIIRDYILAGSFRSFIQSKRSA